MTITKATSDLQLPNPTTPEDLEMSGGKVLYFGDCVLYTGYRYLGRDKPGYYAAIYECLEDKLDPECTIGLRQVSDIEFEDDGHAILWATQQ